MASGCAKGVIADLAIISAVSTGWSNLTIRDWVYWSTRRGRDPTVGPRLAALLKRQGGRCAYCGLFFHYEDRIEIDHIDGDRRHARVTNLQALHGHGHDAKTREHGDYLPHGMRDQHQDTEERSARKRARSVLEQR